MVEAITHASKLVRDQLTVCISEILATDVPEKWQSIVLKVNGYLISEDQETLLGALLAFCQIVKEYQFKNKQEKGPFIKLMQVFLPVLHNRCVSLMMDESSAAALIQAKIFKIFNGLIQVHLHLELINEDNFPQWLDVFKTVLDRPVPETPLQWDEINRPSSSWWKCKKWAIVVLYKIFIRYGDPGLVEDKYADFAAFYDKHFSEQVLQTVLKILDQYRQKYYVSPKVLTQALNYTLEGVQNARSWKVMNPHVQTITREVIFPLMCHTEEDEALWQGDPHKFIKTKYDIFATSANFSPNEAAKDLLECFVDHRTGVLEPVVTFVMEVLNTPEEKSDPKHKDGALHVMGTLARALSRKKTYANHMEAVFVQNLFPAFGSLHGFLRARACWVVQQFAIIKFKDYDILGQTVNHLMSCLLNDKDLPVQIEAGMAMKCIVDDQSDELMQLLREAEVEDLLRTVDELVKTFPDEVLPFVVELTRTLRTP